MEDIYTVIIGEYSGNRVGENIVDCKMKNAKCKIMEAINLSQFFNLQIFNLQFPISKL